MKINRLNYEKYLVDYVDGTLDDRSRVEVNNFIHSNPDIEKELNFYTNAVILEPVDIIYEEKSSVYKKPNYRIILLPLLVIVSLILGIILFKSTPETLIQQAEISEQKTSQVKPKKNTNNITIQPTAVKTIAASPKLSGTTNPGYYSIPFKEIIPLAIRKTKINAQFNYPIKEIRSLSIKSDVPLMAMNNRIQHIESRELRIVSGITTEIDPSDFFRLYPSRTKSKNKHLLATIIPRAFHSSRRGVAPNRGLSIDKSNSILNTLIPRSFTK